MTKPIALLAPSFRTLDELFDPADLARLSDLCTLVWARDEPAPPEVVDSAAANANFIIGTDPCFDQLDLDRAPNLLACLEVAGSFPPSLDYDTCFARNIEVLSCAPAFRRLVAEMTLGFMIAGARGIVDGHEAFRKGTETWLGEDERFDFSLYGQTVGFIGFGSIAQECNRLLAPFGCNVLVYDPWQEADVLASQGVTATALNDVVAKSRCLVIAASPTDENFHLIDGDAFSRMPKGALLVLISRAHLVDFAALQTAIEQRRIRAALDVFPAEPVPPGDPIRAWPNTILSAHRAAAVHHGRRDIGRMVVDDIALMIKGEAPRNMQRANDSHVRQRVGAVTVREAARARH
ncbi:MAG: NAD(P)-dependent oxidoreductase [Pseudomonadota bacterium]